MELNKSFLLILLFFCQLLFAQNKGVENSNYNIQTGLLGVWVNRETKLSNQLALRTEVGLDLGYRGGDFVGKTIFALTPKLSIEPRWYYNILKREGNKKYTKNNSSNFLTIGFNYYPDWFVIANRDNVSVPNQMTIIPKWGIRRAIAKSNFNYELGIGLGKKYYFDVEEWETAADLHIRVGYTF
ncbi:hypothetical protein [Flavobacterium turcicum]|uniref:DUF3575 domain-containing protein n=1 Tax=Flavobacterium turcicum TaxID=2764718 RepID=A0ABR7JHZ5_9FLAO|nr:hypothetical protein [Flavobacterium turcicum]MBC5863769.1 hypothetical protein [Flavobacterium turcicum]NHL02283.1 hypothetical protein [Flavobacterium turcicum]